MVDGPLPPAAEALLRPLLGSVLNAGQQAFVVTRLRYAGSGAATLDHLQLSYTVDGVEQTATFPGTFRLGTCPE